MPHAPFTRCTEPGCGVLTPHGRCEQHMRKPWENPSANSRALSGRQRDTIRKRHLREEPACRVCGSTKDLEVDHIIEIADAGALWDDGNLATLCGPHHAMKTAAHRAARAIEKHFAEG